MKEPSEIKFYEAEKAQDRFNSGYLAFGYMLLIGFICIVGGSLIKLVEVLT